MGHGDLVVWYSYQRKPCLIAGLSGAAIAFSTMVWMASTDPNGSRSYTDLPALHISRFYLRLAKCPSGRTSLSEPDRRKTNRFFEGAQIAGGAAMAFMHGAQDGQKFMGVFLLGLFLAQGNAGSGHFSIPVWLMILCSLVMAAGNFDRRLPDHQSRRHGYGEVGKISGICGRFSRRRLSSALLRGRNPVSTTHTKTTAIMGVGAAKRISCVDWGVVKEMVLTWVLTFPGCGIIGFLMAKLFSGGLLSRIVIQDLCPAQGYHFNLYNKRGACKMTGKRDYLYFELFQEGVRYAMEAAALLHLGIWNTSILPTG